MMDNDQRPYLKELRWRHQRRLQELQLKAATFGISTPPEILTEIEDIQAEIAHLEADLEQDVSTITLSTSAAYASPQHNLPAQATTLIGRERQVAKIAALLRRQGLRLLTLTGPGGIGKTRLGLQIASNLLDDFRDGVYFVGLASISNTSLVPSTIAQSLEIRETVGQTLIESLKSFLRDREILLLLDNFEQIVDAALLISELLTVAPGLKIIVTSRVVLKLYGEHEFVVPPLDLPPLKHLPPFEQLIQYEAMRLFVERALAVKSSFMITSKNALDIAQICYRLDGLPLAIELAAVRIKILTPRKLLEKLDSRLNTLVSGAHDLPTRQQTLRSTIDWSYDMLNDDERKLCARLAVFVSGCTLEAAEIVCGGIGDLSVDVLDILASLVDKNLLRQVDGVDGEPRFLMLETIREYALEKLMTNGEAEALKLRHADCFLTLAKRARSELHGFEQATWLDHLDEEHDNFRSALRWATTGMPEIAARLGIALSRFWEIRGYLSEGRQYLESILACSDELSAPIHADVVASAGHLARLQNDHQQAITLLKRCVDIRRELGDKQQLARALDNLGFAFSAHQKNYLQAIALHEESLVLGRELGDKHICRVSLYYLGQVARQQKEYGRAEKFLAESLVLARELGDKKGESSTIHNLAWIAIAQNNYERATELIKESIDLARQVKDERTTILYLEHLGMVESRQGKYTQAIERAEESLKLARTLGYKSSIASSLQNLGQIEFSQQNYAQAQKRFIESLRLYRELENVEEIVQLLWRFVDLESDQDHLERAARLIGVAEGLTQKLNFVWDTDQEASYDQTVAKVRASLGEEAFAALRTVGQTLTLDQTIAEVLTC